MKVDNLSNLSSRLRQIETEHAADQSGISDSRLVVVNAVELYRKSRYRLGESLSNYKKFFIEQRGWLVAAKIVATEIGCDERTLRRIISDFERVSGVPEIVIKALEQAGIDPAARRNATIIDRILRMPDRGTKSEVESVLSSASKSDKKVESRAEGHRLAVRKKLRAALRSVPMEQKLAELVAALEEEMYLEWGQTIPVTLTLTPRCAQPDAYVDQRMVA